MPEFAIEFYHLFSRTFLHWLLGSPFSTPTVPPFPHHMSNREPYVMVYEIIPQNNWAGFHPQDTRSTTTGSFSLLIWRTLVVSTHLKNISQIGSFPQGSG